MDKREFLRSLGFEVGARGRFSAEMLEALKDYTDPEDIDTPLLPKVKNTPKRTDDIRYYVAELHGGQIIKFDTCSDCTEYILYCHCDDPQPPRWLREEVASWTVSV